MPRFLCSAMMGKHFASKGPPSMTIRMFLTAFVFAAAWGAFVCAAVPQAAAAGTLPRAQEKKEPDAKALRQTAVLRLLELMQAELQGTPEQQAAAADRAVAAYDDLIKLLPDDLDAINTRGIVKEKKETGSGAADFNAVIEKASARIKAAAEDADAYHARAGAYRGLKQFDLARKDYQEAIRLKPDNRKWALDLRAMEIEAPDAPADKTVNDSQ